MDDRAGITGTTTPTLLERWRHIFGVHSWRPVDDRQKLRCPGCGREWLTFETTTEIPGSSAFDTEDPPGGWPTSNDAPGHKDGDGTGEPWRRDERGEPHRARATPPGDEEPASAWEWFQGLRWWVRLWLAFILLQVVLFVASLFTAGGGGGG